MSPSAGRVLAGHIFSTFAEDSTFLVFAKGKADPFEGDGEDFTYVVTPEKFEIIQAESESRLVSTSPSGSKKLYQLLVKTPYVLNLVSFGDLSGLLSKAGIRFNLFDGDAVPFDEFNGELARLMTGLTRDAGATKVRVTSRGTGSKAAQRKVRVETQNFSLDIVLGPGWYSFEDVEAFEEVPFAG